MSEITTNMGRQQPVHPAAEVTVRSWPECEVETVGHETVGDDSHGDADRSLGHDFNERSVVVGLVEHLGTTVAPVEHVIRKSTDRAAGGARHKSPRRVGEAEPSEST